MDDTVENLVTGLLDTMEAVGVPLAGNTRALAILDAQSADKELEDLDERIEELEWNADDYYQIDKDEFETIVTKVMRKMFYDKHGAYMATEEDDFPFFSNDTLVLLQEALEKVNKNKDV